MIAIETTREFVGCASCGVRAEGQDRMPVAVRDLACFGPLAGLVWRAGNHHRDDRELSHTVRRTSPEIAAQNRVFDYPRP